MKKRAYISMIFAVVALSGCQSSLPEKSTENYQSAVSKFYIGLAAIQVGDDQRANQELISATELAKDEPASWNNLGVLQLRQKDFEASAKSLETAKILAPENATVYSNIAVLELQRGNFEKAINNLTKAIELDPKDLKAIYALARERERQNNYAEAQKLFERILSDQTDNTAIQMEVARLAAKQNDTEKLKAIIGQIASKIESSDAEVKEQFENLQRSANESDAKETSKQLTYLRNLMLRLPEFRAAISDVQPSDTSLGKLLEKPLKLPAPDFSPAAPDMALTFSAQTSENLKAKFAKAIFLNSEDSPVVAWSDGNETHIGKAVLSVSTENPFQILAFDFDYDFKNDLAIATEKGFRLFKQIDDGNFQDVTAKTKLPSVILRTSYFGVWTLDVESDGDLDLILSDATVLQNNSDGSFSILKPFMAVKNVRQFEWSDLDEDGDGDAIFLDAFGKASFFSNERGGNFKEKSLPNLGTVSAIALGDINGDGQLDLIVSQNKSLSRISVKSNDADWEISELLKSETIPDNIKIADFDNNGANDLLLSTKSETSFFLAGKDAVLSPLSTKINSQITSFSEMNSDGKLDLIGIDAEGKPAIFQNQSTKTYHWQTLRPKAAKTEGDQRVNSFGIGGEIEIRSGLLSQKQLINAPQVHFGLGEYISTDVVRVVWGNGYVQAEFDVKADQIIAAEQRLKGSCPHLFAWNGSEFALVKDAPPWSPALGLKINAQDTYGILQTEEWFKIPGEFLKPKNEFYELRITGEYWESFYLDNYKLIAVDHPDSAEIFTDERFAIPLPPLKVFTTGLTQNFASAITDQGIDVTDIVRDLDEKYLDGIKRGNFQGVAEDHFVELELPENAPKDEKLWIVADGWTHPTDASINVQRGQIPNSKPPRSLSLEVQAEGGNWITAKENLGFPAGKMKTILIDIPEGARKFRLRTEMEIFWDKLAWAVALPEGHTTENLLELSSAELRYRGFSVIEKLDDSSPEKPVYNEILTTNQRWRDLEGYYTRFGDVSELLQKTDDRFVLANAGDEIILKFPALPEVRKGWKRDFVIIGNGWIKDGDLNSVFSKTILPLPTHATNDYSHPPTTLENDPVYKKNRTDWMEFHTRYVSPSAFRNALRK